MKKVKMKKYSHKKWARHKKRLHRKRKLCKKQLKRDKQIIKECRDTTDILLEVKKNVSNLDLANEPMEKIKDVLNKIPIENLPPFLITRYRPKSTIIRAVANPEKEPSTARELSYPPPEKIKTYQRANTKGHPMFYGAARPKVESEDELKTAQRTAVAEVCKKRDLNAPKDDAYIGTWQVKAKKSINLVTIINPDMKYSTQYLKDILTNYNEKIRRALKGDTKKIKEVLTFFAGIFSNEVKEGEDYNYMISALLTERLLANPKIDGVLYPSVQTNGEGLCIAIRPKSADEKLKLVEVSKFEVNKDDLREVKHCKVAPPHTTFNL
jgi:hypothetical protein